MKLRRPIYAGKVIRCLQIKDKILNGKKNRQSSTVLLCIKGACQDSSESFKRFSSNRSHQFKKRGSEKNAMKVSSIAYI